MKYTILYKDNNHFCLLRNCTDRGFFTVCSSVDINVFQKNNQKGFIELKKDTHVALLGGGLFDYIKTYFINAGYKEK